MDIRTAEYLLSGLEKKAIIPDMEDFFGLLRDTPIPKYPDFYSAIPDNQQRIDEEGNSAYHYISIRRVLRNAGAKNYRPSPLQSASNGFYGSVHGLAGYSSDLMAEKARGDYEISRMLSKSTQPYSLLGKLVTRMDFEKKNVIITKPILVIPGGDLLAIADWELRNAMVSEEWKFGLRKRSHLRSRR